MLKTLWVPLILLAVVVAIFGGGSALAAKDVSRATGPARLAPGATVRVAVRDNPPSVFVDEKGNPQGLFIDLIKEIGRKEGWTLQYTPLPWNESLAALAAGTIDVLPSIAYTEERGRLYPFSQEPVLSSWGQVYVPAASKIASILDLDGKVVAVVKADVYSEGAEGLKQLARRFSLTVDFLEVPNYPAALHAVAEGRADAALTGRLSAHQTAVAHDLVSTPILISPVQLHFAFSPAAPAELGPTIDRHLKALKGDRESLYYQSLNRWLGQEVGAVTPKWLLPALVSLAGGALALALLVVVTRRQVGNKQQQLAQQEQERQKTEATLRKKEQRLNYLETRDPLTGLPNVSLFHDHLRRTLAAAGRSGDQVALVLLGLDRFKKINDSLGHEIGNQLLQEVARRLQSRVYSTDRVARTSGDQFAIFVDEFGDIQQVAVLVRQVLEDLAALVEVGDYPLYTTASAGISVFPDNGDTFALLGQCAEVAMYRAKKGGGNCYQFYAPEMDARAKELLLLESDLRQAVSNQQLVLYYQPQLSLATGEVVGVEALVRWQHPQRGMIPPADFIPLAEETGMIVAMGGWILREACCQRRRWQQDGCPPFRVAVNLSARQFADPNLADMIEKILAETGLDPALLELEITESVVMEDVDAAILTLTDLKVRGVDLSIDDFGTGYSSLSYLKRFPIRKLKIDRSFILDVSSNPQDAAIAAAIIALARSLEIGVIAEGIETEAQLAFLQAKGCAEGQGYLFSRPLPAEEMVPFLKKTALARSSSKSSSTTAPATAPRG